MPVHQYVCFVITSTRTTAQEMTAVLGIEPDETAVRASRSTVPPLPAHHRWKIVCRRTGLRVDEQVACVLDRLRPHTGRLAALAGQLDRQEGPGSAVLQVVRRFHSDNHEPGADLPEEPEGPNLFGWHLDSDVLEFLTTTGAEVDIDEYDMTGDPHGDGPRHTRRARRP
ncbi:DUF4279 domain-containing protein [Streptomyces sp. NPDC008141]|uniref:DUF4279 domain-containing protein n=1 Tax=Streptomyces sp. NPDC008141 TaxID=3364815 RepID=UPI0036EA0970